jgi:hypothetical protein
VFTNFSHSLAEGQKFLVLMTILLLFSGWLTLVDLSGPRDTTLLPYSKQCCQLLANNFDQINQKIRPLAIFPAADIFMRPLMCFAAETSASWQYW